MALSLKSTDGFDIDLLTDDAARPGEVGIAIRFVHPGGSLTTQTIGWLTTADAAKLGLALIDGKAVAVKLVEIAGTLVELAKAVDPGVI